MPSAQHKEFEEPAPVATEPKQTDLNGLLRQLHAAKNSDLNSLHRRGTVLFAQGEPSRGVYILRSGRATVSIASSEGRVVMLRIVEAGDVLGLNSVLQDSPYETTAKTLEPCRTDFIARNDLLELMRRNEAGAQMILQALSQELTEFTNRVKLLLLPQTVIGRLARLLLEWSKATAVDGEEVPRIDRVFTHEELAQMVCSSRETVTRLMTVLIKESIIRVTSDSILIRDQHALAKIAFGDGGHI